MNIEVLRSTLVCNIFINLGAGIVLGNWDPQDGSCERGCFSTMDAAEPACWVTMLVNTPRFGVQQATCCLPRASWPAVQSLWICILFSKSIWHDEKQLTSFKDGSSIFSVEVRRSRAVKRMRVDMHLMKLYQNAAGMLPTKPFVCMQVKVCVMHKIYNLWFLAFP